MLLAVKTRYDRPFSLAIVTVDHYHRIRESCGDAVIKPLLRAVARVIDDHVRTSDFVARCRDDAFAVVLTETRLADAEGFCRRLLTTAHEDSTLDTKLRISVHAVEAETGERCGRSARSRGSCLRSTSPPSSLKHVLRPSLGICPLPRYNRRSLVGDSSGQRERERMNVRSDGSRYGAARTGFHFLDAARPNPRPAARGLAAAGRSLRAGGLSLVPATGRGPRRCGRRGARGVRRRGRRRGPVSPRKAGTQFRRLAAHDHAEQGLRPFPPPARPARRRRGHRRPAAIAQPARVGRGIAFAEREPQPDSRFVHRALDVVRAEFEPRTWDAFWRIAVDGQSPAEVAAAMQLSLPAVYQAKSRVLRRLRRELSDSRNSRQAHL